MSDEPDDTGGGTLVQGPWSSDPTYPLPPIPDFADTVPPPEDSPEEPSGNPEETTMKLPPIPDAPNPVTALRSDGTAVPDAGESDGEYGEVEYEQPRSLADRLGDWLEFRLERARANHEAEAPFREAEIARKVALLEGRTAQEVAMMEQNGKLHTAKMKANSEKTAARGKADADRAKSPSSGLGADKGRTKPGGAGTSPAGGGRGGSSSASPNHSGPPPKPNRSGRSDGSPGSTGGSSGGKSGTKGPQAGSDGRKGGSGGSSSPRGEKGSQTGSGSSGRNGNPKGDGERPASSARGERARGRQERAQARQAERHDRRSVEHAAGLADRTKDRDQARAQRQQAWEDRRAKRQERAAERKAKREAANPGRTTLGQALGEEAQRRWDQRRADAKDGNAGAEKVNLTKDNDKTKGAGGKATNDGPDSAANATKGPSSDTPGPGPTPSDGPSDGTTKSKRRRFRNWRTGRTGPGRTGRARRDSPFDTQYSTLTVEWPDRPPRQSRTTSTGNGEDNIVDADIVPDGPAAKTPGAEGLPPASEKHTKRPATSRPSTERNSMGRPPASQQSGHRGLAAQHRTDITFDQYLVEMANTAVKAASHEERSEALTEALAQVANVLRDMAVDLGGDHNITTAVTDLIADLADSAARMKAQAKRCAEQCGIAKEAARLAAASVARVYGEDMNAKEDVGLTHTSSAAHHD